MPYLTKSKCDGKSVAFFAIRALKFIYASCFTVLPFVAKRTFHFLISAKVFKRSFANQAFFVFLYLAKLKFVIYNIYLYHRIRRLFSLHASFL